MIITKESHLDHGLLVAHYAWVLRELGDGEGFKIATLEIPSELPAVECALHGPVMGDDPIADDCTFERVRGDRPGPSRMVYRDPRPTRKLTVIMGPDKEGRTVLYTAFGGPATPREPFDPGLDDAGREESRAFWATHALADGEIYF
jgi:hypothetical protein